ncbi:MAG: molybdate ABC transporter substrate-binding protein [Thiotrichaceae bacterium]|nr:molybdate ABC transporter substrate-binding protein [Thiotrichaceae bacterium]
MFKKIIFLMGLLSNLAYADEIHVGCVSNFMATAEEIAHLFEKTAQHSVKLVSSSSGKLAKAARETQDFEVILLGDLKIAQDLDAAGFVAKDSRFTYSIGKLALWSKNSNLIDKKGDILRTEKFEHIIFPNVYETAYGIAAKKILEEMGIWARLETKAIFAPNVADARDMIAAEKAELGFTALSLLNPQKKIEGSVWIVPQKLYSPIEQQAVLLKFAENKPAARAFIDFLKTPQAQNIIEKYSYSVPVRKP